MAPGALRSAGASDIITLTDAMLTACEKRRARVLWLICMFWLFVSPRAALMRVYHASFMLTLPPQSRYEWRKVLIRHILEHTHTSAFLAYFVSAREKITLFNARYMGLILQSYKDKACRRAFRATRFYHHGGFLAQGIVARGC